MEYHNFFVAWILISALASLDIQLYFQKREVDGFIRATGSLVGHFGLGLSF